jgi:hypothetical protein
MADLPPAPPRPKQPPGSQQRPAQPRQNNRMRAPKKQRNIWMIPVIFLGFVIGAANLLAAPIIYVYEIIQYNKKDQWPGWSVMDGLNYEFFETRPFFFANEKLYQYAAKTPYFDHVFSVPAVAKVVNYIVYLYCDSSIVFITLVNGIILVTLSVRAAIFGLNKEQI